MLILKNVSCNSKGLFLCCLLTSSHCKEENGSIIFLLSQFFNWLQAMLVHPDKNMGNEKAAEAFKKLQNAYEVNLLVSTQ